MVYDKIEDAIADEIAPLKTRLGEIETLIAEKREAIRTEDNKFRKTDLREEENEIIRERRRIWGTIENIKQLEFRKLLAEEYDLPLTHPKFDRVYNLAYQHGHGSGYSDVENYFSEFVELVKD